MRVRVTEETAFLRKEYQTYGLDHLTTLVGSRGRGITALDYVLRAPDGTALAGEIPSVVVTHPGWLTAEIPEGSDDGGYPERVRALVTDLGDGLLVAVGDDLGRISEVEAAIATAFLWTVGLAAFLGIAGGALLSRAFLNRVDVIARTAEAIIGGDLARRIPVRGTGDDLDRLAATLNHMLDRISVLMDSLRQVSTDVAHDLRTPLSRLYQRLEDSRRHAQSLPEYEIAVEAAVKEAEGLLETFSALLRIAQVEGASPRAAFREVDLSGTTENVADAYRLDAEEEGHRFVAEITPGILIYGDQELLTQAVANLVENALRHTPIGTQICLRLARCAGPGACLAVEDDGPGVEAEDLPRLANRFYRGERSRTTPGNGLGLSLVSAVAELHGAKLQLEQKCPGLYVALQFPLISSSQ